jgi:hypothetical protein
MHPKLRICNDVRLIAMLGSTPVLIAALVMLAACAGNAPPPQTWSLSHLPQADLRDMERSPALRVELMIALKVARKRCAGPDFPVLNRTEVATFAMRADPERTAYGGRENIDGIGDVMGFEYRRAYGDQWWNVVSTEMQAARRKYERHPDPAAFCQAAETALAQMFLTEGRDRIVRFDRAYRTLSPENARPGTAALP